MTDQTPAADIVERLRELLAKATKGPWEIDTERSEGEYGSAPDTSTGYEDFLIGAEINGKWATLLTTENATEKLIEEDYDEDYHRAWDAIGEANSNLVIAAVNALPALLDEITRLRAREAELASFDLIPEGEHAAALIQIEALQRKLDEAGEVIGRMLPSNLGAIPDHVPDDFIFPCDMEAGEIRQARAALSKITGGGA